MNIVNLIHIGEDVKNFDAMSEEEKREAARKLNAQALRHLGYERRKEKRL